MQLLLAALGALACLASAKVSIIVDPSTTTTTVTVDTSTAGCSAAADGPDVDGPMGFVCEQSYKSDADAARWVSYLDEWAPKAKELGVLGAPPHPPIRLPLPPSSPRSNGPHHVTDRNGSLTKSAALSRVQR